MKKIILYLAIGLITFYIYNSFKAAYDLWEKKKVLYVAQKELEKVKKENTSLKKQLQIVSTQDYIDKEAHNKLFLLKPNEKEVFIAKELFTYPNPHDQRQEQGGNHIKEWLQILGF